MTPEVLHGQGLAQGNQKIKVLGRGELTKALKVKAHKFSGAAAAEDSGRRRQRRELVAGLGEPPAVDVGGRIPQVGRLLRTRP